MQLLLHCDDLKCKKMSQGLITENERDAVYKTIYSRRDTRSEFLNKPIPQDVLHRILNAAHHAPSVGFMQPWDFIVIQDSEIKEKIKSGFEAANQQSAKMFSGERQEKYKSLKLEGIMEAPIGVCVTCDRERTGPVVLGRTVQKEMDLYSSVCAVQTLWLAARAENIGVGWVSIVEKELINEVLEIPRSIVPIAYLCMGYVESFHEEPELEKAGWLPRVSVDEVIHYNKWSNHK